MTAETPSMGQLWYDAGGGTPAYSRERYLELLLEHGYLTVCLCACHADGSGHCEKCRPELPCGWPGDGK